MPDAPAHVADAVPVATPAGTRSPPDVAAVLAESKAQRWYRRPWAWVLAALLLVGLAALAWWWSGRAARAAPQYQTQAVTRGTLTLRVSANGTLQPTRSINIGSELSARYSRCWWT